MGYKQYCKDYENIENYEAAKKCSFKGWYCHHRLETHNSDGERRTVDITAAELKVLDMYYNRPAEELIFLTSLEHNRLHNKGKPRTEETKHKIGAAMKGKPKTEETKKKMSEARKGKQFTEEHKKKLSEAHKGKPGNANGKHWYNNGKINIMVKECPEGFVPGILK